MLYNHWTTSTLCLTQTIFDPRTLNISLHLHLEIRNTFLSGAVPCQKSKKLPYWLLDKNSHQLVKTLYRWKFSKEITAQIVYVSTIEETFVFRCGTTERIILASL